MTEPNIITKPTTIVGSQKIKESSPALLIIGFSAPPRYVNIEAPKKNIPIPNAITNNPIIIIKSFFICEFGQGY